MVQRVWGQLVAWVVKAWRLIWPFVVGEDLYLYGVFRSNKLFAIQPLEKRLRHTLETAMTGWGKTELKALMVLRDLYRAAEGKGGCAVIDPHRDLFARLSRLRLFSPGGLGWSWLARRYLLWALGFSLPRLQNLSKKLILVDFQDVDYAVQLNPLDINWQKIRKIKESHLRMAAENAVHSTFSYIFSSQGSGMKVSHETVLRFCSRVVSQMPEPDLLLLLDLLKDPKPFAAEIEQADPVTRKFFHDQFDGKDYKLRRQEVAARIWALLGNPVFAGLFLAKQNKLDLAKIMNQGKVVLINIPKSVLQEETATAGRFFIAKFLQAAYTRAAVSEEKRKPFFLYVDEAQNFMSPKVAELFSEARKFGLGFIGAHQYLGQFDKDVSEAVKSNVGSYLIGRVSQGDVSQYAAWMDVPKDQLMAVVSNLKAVHRVAVEFLVFVKGVTQFPIRARIPLGLTALRPLMSDKALEKLRQQQRRKYCARAMGERKSAIKVEPLESLE